MEVGREIDQRNYVDVDVRVRYAETDQMGVAYYGSYVVWFEVGRFPYALERVKQKDTPYISRLTA